MNNILNGILVVSPGHALGIALKGSVGVKNLVFHNIVMLHIKLKVIMSRISNNYNFHPKGFSKGFKRSYLM